MNMRALTNKPEQRMKSMKKEYERRQQVWIRESWQMSRSIEWKGWRKSMIEGSRYELESWQESRSWEWKEWRKSMREGSRYELESWQESRSWEWRDGEGVWEKTVGMNKRMKRMGKEYDRRQKVWIRELSRNSLWREWREGVCAEAAEICKEIESR
jgi:hypothetical protein